MRCAHGGGGGGVVVASAVIRINVENGKVSMRLVRFFVFSKTSLMRRAKAW